MLNVEVKNGRKKSRPTTKVLRINAVYGHRDKGLKETKQRMPLLVAHHWRRGRSFFGPRSRGCMSANRSHYFEGVYYM